MPPGSSQGSDDCWPLRGIMGHLTWYLSDTYLCNTNTFLSSKDRVNKITSNTCTILSRFSKQLHDSYFFWFSHNLCAQKSPVTWLSLVPSEKGGWDPTTSTIFEYRSTVQQLVLSIWKKDLWMVTGRLALYPGLSDHMFSLRNLSQIQVSGTHPRSIESRFPRGRT